jgi:hypothetical protein
MAGKCRRASVLSLAGVLLAAAAAGAAAGEVVKGQSRELGIQFEVRGGDAWCKPDVAVALTAPKVDVFQPEARPFVQMLGRIRAVVMDQCPTVERIVFEAAAQRRAVVAIEMTRLTRWQRLIAFDPETRRPVCPRAEPAAAECGKRADAYLAVHRIMRGDQFAAAELTTVLDEQDEAHAVWVDGGVVGKLTVRDRGDLPARYASNAELGEAVAGAVVAQCRRDGGAPEPVWAETWFAGSEREIAVRGLSCRPRAGPAGHHALLVTSAGSRFHVLALRAEGSDAEAVRTAARQLATAMGAAE